MIRFEIVTVDVEYPELEPVYVVRYGDVNDSSEGTIVAEFSRAIPYGFRGRLASECKLLLEEKFCK